ncbi:hypothetical protein GLOTRDRAFT_116299 [Gloeophyllum trabeum ATCC 11539]|uniref:rRNA-processing protein EFG1 n=1 Tax=Gloeophyllum trabeum (strain ATCC 11539 / FP-39264 / Madison 617) TaxID=670483 RepID=S7Q7A1_GLOTA|nr:uncharacterized protein GLOTRDRAFT_116299 [Gloeophyllum trabeum ATCC 11539]EPQ55407.1 hypothetical protein GLOTRDRAFT_116299 [Gloeophyllum trabeum ATCC 11539]
MAPSRTRDPGPSTQPKPKKARRPKAYHGQDEPTGVPGVQKLKAQLRSVRRLLAKDNLAADVRVETERRLRALEADLEAAERARKERALAVRYHKVKFFERQKVVRKIAQTKKKLARDGLRGSERKELEGALAELRVDLNYILHYPRLEKYISLFPPEVRLGEVPPPEQAKEKAKTDKRRAELRARIRREMEAGELGGEPELEKGGRARSDHERSRGEGRKGGEKRGRAEKKGMEDDFFAGDEETDGGGGDSGSEFE